MRRVMGQRLSEKRNSTEVVTFNVMLVHGVRWKHLFVSLSCNHKN